MSLSNKLKYQDFLCIHDFQNKMYNFNFNLPIYRPENTEKAHNSTKI